MVGWQEVALNAFFFLAGALVSVWISAHYFRKVKTRRLTPYILSSSSLLQADSLIKKDIEVRYKGKPVEGLHYLELLVANDGEEIVSDIQTPIEIQFPSSFRVLEADMIHVEPQERPVKFGMVGLEGPSSTAQFSVAVLNPGEFFIAKFLGLGNLKTEELKITVNAPGVPASLRPSGSPPIATKRESPKDRIYQTFAIVISSLVLMIVTLSFVRLGWLLWLARPDLFPYPWDSFALSWPNNVALGVFLLFSLIFVIASIIAVVALFASVPSLFKLKPQNSPSFALSDEVQKKIRGVHYRRRT